MLLDRLNSRPQMGVRELCVGNKHLRPELASIVLATGTKNGATL